MRHLAILFGVLLSATVLTADQRTINFDADEDFSRIKTFAIGEMKNQSSLPELNNPLLGQTVADAIRAQLKAKNLRETSDKPDVLMNVHIDDLYYDGPARDPRRPISAGSKGPVQGILVLDMVKRESMTLIWQGTYRDDEDNGSNVARNLPSDAAKVLSQYPPKKRKP